MLIALLIALGIVAVVYAAVSRINLSKVGFRQLEKGEPDFVMGVIVMILALALVVVAFRYGREDATQSSKVMLTTYATIGFVWGAQQVLGARRWTRKRKKPAAGPQDGVKR